MYIDRKKKVLIFRILCLVMLGGLFFRGCLMPGIQFLRESSFDENESKVKNKKYREFYLSFLKDDIIQNAKIIDNFSSRSKPNYLVVNYQDARIFFHKVDLKKTAPLSKLVKLEKRVLGQSPDVIYAGSESFLYSSQPFALVDNVTITFDIALTDHTIEGDSLMNISYLATKSSFRYESKGVVDMVFKSLDESSPISINTVLLNKGDYVLLIVAFSQNRGITLRSTFLQEMLK